MPCNVPAWEASSTKQVHCPVFPRSLTQDSNLNVPSCLTHVFVQDEKFTSQILIFFIFLNISRCKYKSIANSILESSQNPILLGQ